MVDTYRQIWNDSLGVYLLQTGKPASDIAAYLEIEPTKEDGPPTGHWPAFKETKRLGPSDNIPHSISSASQVQARPAGPRLPRNPRDVMKMIPRPHLEPNMTHLQDCTVAGYERPRSDTPTTRIKTQLDICARHAYLRRQRQWLSFASTLISHLTHKNLALLPTPGCPADAHVHE